jgi:hypothetical protein
LEQKKLNKKINMKKFLIAMAILLTLPVTGQDLKIGLSLAPTFNFNKLSLKDSNGKYVTLGVAKGMGWKGGIIADFPFSDNYYLHSGFLIHQKSAEYDAITNKITTLEIPLSVKMISNEFTSGMAISATFGGTFDLNVSQKNIINDVETSTSDDLNTFGFSFVTGLGINYDLGFGTLDAGLSYHLGLTDISKGGDTKNIPKHLAIDFKFYF